MIKTTQANRMDMFSALKKHPYYGSLIKKLGKSELNLITVFCQTHHSTTRDEFVQLANRYFLDKPKPKNWQIISDILTAIG